MSRVAGTSRLPPAAFQPAEHVGKKNTLIGCSSKVNRCKEREANENKQTTKGREGAHRRLASFFISPAPYCRKDMGISRVETTTQIMFPSFEYHLDEILIAALSSQQLEYLKSKVFCSALPNKFFCLLVRLWLQSWRSLLGVCFLLRFATTK